MVPDPTPADAPGGRGGPGGDEPAELGFLITGTARSGTTLVQRLACELPGVWVPQETHFWPRALEVLEDFEWPIQGDDRKTVVTALLEEIADGELPLRPRAVMKQIFLRRRGLGLWTLFESLVAALSPPDRRMLGEKTPNHMFWWERLHSRVPGLKLIVVVREPTDVLRSHHGVEWGERDAHVLAERWLTHQRAAFDAARLYGTERVLVLRYEDVAADPEGSRARIAALLGVEHEPAPLKPKVLSRYPLFPEREGWKARALGEIAAGPSPAPEVSEEDSVILETACGALMGHFGYPRRTAGDARPPTGESLERVLSFRRWHASVTGSLGLPIY